MYLSILSFLPGIGAQLLKSSAQAQFQIVARLGRRGILLSPHDACPFPYIVRAKDS